MSMSDDERMYWAGMAAYVKRKEAEAVNKK